MKPIQLLPVWAILALQFLCGCNTMSERQCSPGQRVIAIRNFTLEPITITWDGGHAALDFDESLEIVQHAGVGGMVKPVTVHVHWSGGVQDFFYPGVVVDTTYFFGHREILDLIKSKNARTLVNCCY
ncbi:MAG: hypothetical protein KBD47_00015 [Candidatus Pacebacteria bacterium]|nr:hypothetical protein [Candidatus Paceibacterota bacterium]